jgi:hypothetical protein
MTHKLDIQCATHLSTALTPAKLRKAVASTIKFLKKKEFDAIAFRGLSGQLFAPIVALRLRKTLLAVRKGEDTHSTQMVEGDFGARNYIIIDDFITGGNTVNQIIKEIHTIKPTMKCVGYFGYNRAWEDITFAGWREPNELTRYCYGQRHEEALWNRTTFAEPEKETMLTVDSLAQPVGWKFKYSVQYPMDVPPPKPEEMTFFGYDSLSEQIANECGIRPIENDPNFSGGHNETLPQTLSELETDGRRTRHTESPAACETD